MKNKIVLALFSFLICNSAFSEKLNLECDALDFRVQSELNKPLSIGELRSADQSKAGFLKSDIYSLKLTIQCEGKKADKVCVSLADSNYCPKPGKTFRIKGIKKDNGVVMVSDRCMGGWTKYQKVGESEDSESFLDHEVYFQLKNQIYSGINIAQKPLLHVLKNENDENLLIKLTSFHKQYWQINQFDPLVGKLKVNVEGYEKDVHHEFELSGACATL